VTDRTEQTARRTDIWVLWTPEGRERQQVKEEEQEDIEFFCWCVLGEEGMWGLLGLCVWICGLGYRERESKEEGVLDLELVVIRSAAWGHTHVKKIQNCKEILRILSAGTS
jgi:hypothetical protein